MMTGTALRLSSRAGERSDRESWARSWAHTAAPLRKRLTLTGPAFVAAVAYVDPGNVATNLTAGARYGYLLIWVLVAATVMAGLVQYLSAKLGVVTGRSLPELVRDRLGSRMRIAFWLQAESVALATDLAEVVGGAIALGLLFGLPLPIGGLITGLVSMVLLAGTGTSRQRRFERVVVGLLSIVTVGFVAGLFIRPPDGSAVAGGLVPHFEGGNSVLLAAGMFGATVMPHAVYLHSAASRDRFGRVGDPDRFSEQFGSTGSRRVADLLRATRLDVCLAMILAGGVNVAMLLLAATALHGVAGTDTIEGAHAALSVLAPAVGLAFAIGLLASGLASTSVGCYAGSVILEGIFGVRIPLLVRRAITLVPALFILAVGTDPTSALVLSQAILSFGIPLALIPLVVLTADRGTMGRLASTRPVTVAASVVAIVAVALNVTLIGLLVGDAIG